MTDTVPVCVADAVLDFDCETDELEDEVPVTDSETDCVPEAVGVDVAVAVPLVERVEDSECDEVAVLVGDALRDADPE